MNIRKLFSLIFLLVLTNSVWGQQPFGGCWHPDYVRDWKPENDPDAKFNRSTVALQPRIADPVIKANPYQYSEGKVAACLTMNPMCSQTPSQGANNFIGYNPTYWQYMDLLIWWGGSAGEGIIIPPSAPVTDAAHQSGVKVLGQVFFPPGAFGGQGHWVTQMLTKEGNTYPYAKQMYEMAKFYGFDGWFINEEITFSAYITEWTAWTAYFNECAAADGNTHMEIQWYDCGTSIGNKMNFLKLHNTSYFLNYGSPSTGNISSQMGDIQAQGYTKEEATRKLYFGIECAQGGFTGNGNYYKNLFSKEGHKGSIDLFNPEEGIWKKVVESLLGKPSASGDLAYEKMNTVFSNESRFWVNAQADVTNSAGWSGSTWPGFANALLERSTIQTKPFVTSFSAGLGKHRFVNGEKKGTQDWYHRGMQDIMPTWRWWIENKQINISLNWDDAYNQGTSLKVAGKILVGQEQLTRLYKTNLEIASGDKFRLVYKTSHPNTMEVKLATSEDVSVFTTFPVTETSQSNGWSVCDIDLSSLNGKTVSIIALNFKSDEAVETYETYLGELAVLPANYAPAQQQVSNLMAQNELKAAGGDIRVIWDAPVSSDIHHYNVYFERGGENKLVGQTRNEGFYIPKFVRADGENSVNVYVAAVTNDMVEGTPVLLTVSFPAMGIPDVRLKAAKTLVKPNEEVAITAFATNFPTAYNWAVPTGATLVSQTDNQAVFSFANPGKYDISVTVVNEVGDSTCMIEQYIEVSEAKVLERVSVGKTIHSSSGYLGQEAPKWIIDGVTVPGSVNQKWCIGGAKEHWVVIDLGTPHNLYSFSIWDCGHKENVSDNIKSYRILLSNDATNWNEVLNESNRPENTKTDYIKPTVARYVKFVPYDEEMPITIRIWEFEIFGTQSNLEIAIPAPVDTVMGTTVHHDLAFSLGGDPKAENFGITVTSADPAIAVISNVVVNEETGRLSYDVTTNNPGTTNVTIHFQNGTWFKDVTFNVKSNVNLQQPENITTNINTIVPVELTFGLGGQPQADNFEVTVVSAKAESVAIENLEVNVAEGTIKFNLVAKADGNVTVTVTLKNGTWEKAVTFKVRSIDPNFSNMAEGVLPTVETTGRYDENTLVSSMTDANEATYWLSGYGSGDHFKVFIDLGKPCEISKFRTLFKASGGNFRDPAYLRIYLGMIEDSYEEVVNLSANIKGDMVFELPEAVLGQFLKIEAAGRSSYGVGVCEVEAWGQIATELPEPEVDVFTPIEVTGFNQDLVAEDKPSLNFSSTAMDDQGWVFFAPNIQAQGSLPASREIASATSKPYKMAAYDGFNTLLKKDGTDGILTLDEPAQMKGYMLLTTSANGVSTVSVKTTYTDESTDIATISIGDWFSDTSSGSAVYGLSRIIRAASDNYVADQIDDRYKFRMFENRIATDPEKTVASVTINRTSTGGYPMVFAVTKITKDTGTGVDESQLNETRIYPNPIKNGTNLQVELPESAEIRIVSAQGSVMLMYQGQAGINAVSIDQFTPGVYFVKVSNENGVKVEKLMIK